MTVYEKVFTKRDPHYGGVGVMITGLPGCGKTNALAAIALGEFKKNNVVVWRGKDTCQWTILLNKTDKVIFWLKKTLDYRLIDREKGKEIYLEDIVKVNRYATTKKMVKGLNKKKINIIQTMPVNVDWAAQHGKFISEWTQIMKHMCNRYYSTPMSLIFDEIEDLAPEGKFYGKASAVSEMTKELRKNYINYFFATQRTTEVIWKLLNKIPWHIYMTGAMPKKKSKVYPSVTAKLKQGQAIIEGQRFEQMNWPFIGREKNYRAIIKLSKKERDRLKEVEARANLRKDDTKKELYLAIYKDVREHNMTQVEASRKYKFSQQRISQIIRDVEKTLL